MQNSIISEVYKDDHIKLVINSRMIELEVAKRGWKQAYNEWDERNMKLDRFLFLFISRRYKFNSVQQQTTVKKCVYSILEIARGEKQKIYFSVGHLTISLCQL